MSQEFENARVNQAASNLEDANYKYNLTKSLFGVWSLVNALGFTAGIPEIIFGDTKLKITGVVSLALTIAGETINYLNLRKDRRELSQASDEYQREIAEAMRRGGLVVEGTIEK